MRRPYFLLWIISVLSVGAGIPYAFELQSEAIASAPFPLPILVLIALAQTAIMLGLAIYLGKKLAKAIGLNALAFGGIKDLLRFGVPLGILAALLIYAMDFYFRLALTPQFSIDSIHPTLWKTLLASLYGGVVEEVLMRLFLMTLLAWIISKIFRAENPAQNKPLMWSAILTAAIIFGLGHLPVTAAITAITPLIVLRAVILNGIGGLIFGWLYWRKGLEYAILAHFTADIFLLTVFPALPS